MKKLFAVLVLLSVCALGADAREGRDRGDGPKDGVLRKIVRISGPGRTSRDPTFWQRSSAPRRR